MGRARAAIHAEWEPDALSRSRWSAAHTLKEIEEAEAEATGKRQRLIAGARCGNGCAPPFVSINRGGGMMFVGTLVEVYEPVRGVNLKALPEE